MCTHGLQHNQEAIFRLVVYAVVFQITAIMTASIYLSVHLHCTLMFISFRSIAFHALKLNVNVTQNNMMVMSLLSLAKLASKIEC